MGFFVEQEWYLILCSQFLGFADILEKKSAGHPFENVPVLLPPISWLGPHPTPRKFC
jgi:hypothetical protein